MSALLPIQTALHAKLTGDTSLTAKVAGVFDQVPQNQPCPYVVIGDATEGSFDTMERSGRDVVETLHIWSQYAGYKEALEILEIINGLLDGQDLAVTGWGTVGMVFEPPAQTLRDPDGVTRHVVARYRIIVQPNI